MVKGFLKHRTRDLIAFDIPYIVSKTPVQHQADFQLSLKQYLEWKNSILQKAAINYLIDDCLMEIRKSKGHPHKTDLLKLIHQTLNAQLAIIDGK